MHGSRRVTWVMESRRELLKRRRSSRYRHRYLRPVWVLTNIFRGTDRWKPVRCGCFCSQNRIMRFPRTAVSMSANTPSSSVCTIKWCLNWNRVIHPICIHPDSPGWCCLCSQGAASWKYFTAVMRHCHRFCSPSSVPSGSMSPEFYTLRFCFHGHGEEQARRTGSCRPYGIPVCRGFCIPSQLQSHGLGRNHP